MKHQLSTIALMQLQCPVCTESWKVDPEVWGLGVAQDKR